MTHEIPSEYATAEIAVFAVNRPKCLFPGQVSMPQWAATPSPVARHNTDFVREVTASANTAALPFPA
jgi:hypothetical protein